MYSAEISRKNPGCFIFLLDQSASMEDPFGGSNDRRKADELATIINKLIHNLSIRCAKGDSMYDYFHVAVIGYGQDSVVALPDPAAGGSGLLDAFAATKRAAEIGRASCRERV